MTKNKKRGKKGRRVKARYRIMRKLIKLYRDSMIYAVKVRYRFMRRLRFRIIRLATFFFFRLWIREMSGIDNVPFEGPALLVSNHLSYYDFLILGALFNRQIVFVAVQKIQQTFFIRWFTKLHVVIYVNRDRPGATFFRDLIRSLYAGKIVVIYPEGSRSRTGKMMLPKPGFIKLAMKANIPIIPVAMKGTYEILPSHRHIPKLTKCSVCFGKKIYISPENRDFRDIFFEDTKDKKLGDLDKHQIQAIAIRLMDKIRHKADEDWDPSARKAVEEAFKKRKRSVQGLVGRLG